MLRMPNILKFDGRLIIIAYYITQVVAALILFDVVRAMELSISTKYETKTLIAIYFMVNDLAQRTYHIFSFFFVTEFAKLNRLTV